MYSFNQRLVGNVRHVREALDHEPGIQPNFSKADITTIIVVMYAVMSRGSFTSYSLYEYLTLRGCPFDRKTIEFLLDAYEGPAPDQHLWQRDHLGAYVPLFTAAPAWEE